MLLHGTHIGGGIAAARRTWPAPGRAQRLAFGAGASGAGASGAGSGFGRPASKQKRVDMSGGMAVPLPKPGKKAPVPPAQQPQQQPAGAGGSDWAVVGKVDDMFTLEKPNRPVILPSGIKLCVYSFGGKVYASQLESTAYQFPLFDAKVSQQGDRVLVEVPLDGTQYDLATGEVLKWCPREGGLLRGVLGALKSNQPAVPLKVYPVQVAKDGTISVKLI